MPGLGKLHVWKETYRLTPFLRNMRKLTGLGLPEETIAFSLIRSESLLEAFTALWNPGRKRLKPRKCWLSFGLIVPQIVDRCDHRLRPCLRSSLRRVCPHLLWRKV